MADLGRARRERARPDRHRARAAARAHRRAERDEPASAEASGAIKVAIVGRPNVGKSTLVNALLGEERVIAFDEPGTTRDAIHLDFERDGRRYTLIDTAGVRRRGKVFEAVEKFSVIKTLQAIEDANVVCCCSTRRTAISEQDAHIAGYILEAGRALVVGGQQVGRAPTRTQRATVKRDLERKLGFLDVRRAALHLGARRPAASARCCARWTGLRGRDGAAADAAADPRAAARGGATAAAARRDGAARSCAMRTRAASTRRSSSSTASALRHVPDAYRRYLEHFFSDAFQLRGTPLRIQFKTGVNPYADSTARR